MKSESRKPPVCTDDNHGNKGQKFIFTIEQVACICEVSHTLSVSPAFSAI